MVRQLCYHQHAQLTAADSVEIMSGSRPTAKVRLELSTSFLAAGTSADGVGSSNSSDRYVNGAVTDGLAGKVSPLHQHDGICKRQCVWQLDEEMLVRSDGRSLGR